MDIVNKTVLVIGGWGLVGGAVCRKLIAECPKKIIITSLKKEEAFDQVKKLRKEFPLIQNGYLIPWWGNILVRNEYKDEDRVALLTDKAKRKILMQDILEDLNKDILQNAALYKLIKKYKPDIIIDCINTATGIAYQDIYSTYKRMKYLFTQKPSTEKVIEETEKLFCTMYTPQLIRHIQILYNAMHEAKTKIYFKIGTSGTGGMGLNIPYTHSEERPSRVLLSKSAIAGAHTLLLFLMARTPDSAITKEIKPTAAIAWKKIEFASVKKRGKEIELFDLPLSSAIKLEKKFSFSPPKEIKSLNESLRSVFIDTGENGIFSRGEFEAITAQKQMEFVTPEEIAESIIFEIKGGNTGNDIINALDNATLNPSYRAGYLQHFAVNKMAELEQKHDVHSVAFEMLGPPRLSKLLFELHLLKMNFGFMKNIISISPKKLSEAATKLISENEKLRSEILSIGIGILFPDGKTFLRGKELKIPVKTGDEEISLSKKMIDDWANNGWIDLRITNMRTWLNRLHMLMKEAESIDDHDEGSQHVRTKQYWNNFETIDIGRVVSWLFINEERGNRMKD